MYQVEGCIRYQCDADGIFFLPRALLRNPDVQKDPRRYLQAVQKVIACMTLGINVSKLFSEMIMVRGIIGNVQR